MAKSTDRGQVSGTKCSILKRYASVEDALADGIARGLGV